VERLQSEDLEKEGFQGALNQVGRFAHLMLSVTEIMIRGKAPCVKGGWIEGVPYVPGQNVFGFCLWRSPL
jgi:hypothetical protein